jgi:hypothetical protein
MNNRKNTIIAVILVAVAGFIVYSMWTVIERRVTNNENENQGNVCAADVIQCADGAWVGRSGPQCQFICPTGTSTPESDNKETSFQGGVGQEVGGLGVRITPTQVVEDSRCPNGVQCIQAGTVRVRATLVSGLGTATPVFVLDKPITTETEIVTLVAVSPVPTKDVTITNKDYVFTWKVTKR